MTSLPVTTSPRTLSDIHTLKQLILSQARTIAARFPAAGSLDIICLRKPDGSCTAELIVYELPDYSGQHRLLYRGHFTRNSFAEALEGLWNAVVAGTNAAVVQQGWVVIERWERAH